MTLATFGRRHDRTEEQPRFAKLYPRAAIKALADKYKIPSERIPAFENTLWTVFHISELRTELLAQPKAAIAPKEDAKDLRKALEKVLSLLKSEELARRFPLEVAVPRYEKVDSHIVQQPSTYESLRKTLEDFIPKARDAENHDVRKSGVSQRPGFHLRLAAYALHRFWVNELRKAPSVQSRGGRKTQALQFLLDCLVFVEPAIKEASIRGFEKLGSDPQEA